MSFIDNWFEEQERTAKEELKQSGKLEGHAIVYCPSCLVEQEDTWDYELRDDSPEIIDCSDCGVKFRITAHYSVDYDVEALKTPNEE